MLNRLIKIDRVKNKLSTLIKEINTTLRKASGKSDYKRWGTERDLSPDWDSRTKQIANLIEPGTSVIEFGAGRLVLKTFLPDKCSYTPSDLVDRGNGTIVCDLNSDTLPQFQHYDVAVFSGVLEYINDVPRLISHLANFVTTIIASYAIADTNQKTQKRRTLGWVNDYTAAQLVDIFENAGFQCDRTEEWKSTVIKSQMIYKFIKKN
jgi:hypothetical protein